MALQMSNGTPVSDDANLLDESVLSAVRFAMQSGAERFTTPTASDDSGRIDWAVRTWFYCRDGKTFKTTVASHELNAHLEVMGDEIELTGGSRPNAELQKRANRR